MGELQSQQRAGAEKEAEPVSHTVIPLNAGASTHRWARATLRGLAATLARRLLVLACSVRRARERREACKMS
jgi:hypothetical protein